MVNRLQIEKGKCVVVDFDNTFIKGNSTELLYFYLLKLSVKRKLIGNIFSLFNIIIKRKLKLISHRELKHHLVVLSNRTLKNEDYENFTSSLFRIINPQVFSILKEYRNSGYKILIATAANHFIFKYFNKFFADFEFDCLATQFHESKSEFIENSGNNKLKNVEDYLCKKRLHCEVVISDHYDDLPLFKYNTGINYLINPSKKTLNVIKRNFHNTSLQKLYPNIYQF